MIPITHKVIAVYPIQEATQIEINLIKYDLKNPSFDSLEHMNTLLRSRTFSQQKELASLTTQAFSTLRTCSDGLRTSVLEIAVMLSKQHPHCFEQLRPILDRFLEDKTPPTLATRLIATYTTLVNQGIVHPQEHIIIGRLIGFCISDQLTSGTTESKYNARALFLLLIKNCNANNACMYWEQFSASAWTSLIRQFCSSTPTDQEKHDLFKSKIDFFVSLVTNCETSALIGLSQNNRGFLLDILNKGISENVLIPFLDATARHFNSGLDIGFLTAICKSQPQREPVSKQASLHHLLAKLNLPEETKDTLRQILNDTLSRKRLADVAFN